MNGHTQNQSGLENSMAEPNGHTTDQNHSIPEIAAVPLPESNGHAIDVKNPSEPHELDANRRKCRRRRCCYCWISCAAVVVVIVVTIVVLALTVFKEKEPKIAVTSMSVEGVKASLDIPAMKVHVNLTLLAGMAVKNRNKIASFKHEDSTTIILYRGNTVGEAVIPAGTIKADKTVNKNVTVTVYVDQFLESPSKVIRDGISGTLNMTTRTEMAGKVKLLGIIKMHAIIRVECEISVNVASGTSERQCDRSQTIKL